MKKLFVITLMAGGLFANAQTCFAATGVDETFIYWNSENWICLAIEVIIAAGIVTVRQIRKRSKKKKEVTSQALH